MASEKKLIEVLKNRVTTLKFLRKNYYIVNVDDAISKMRDSFEKESEPFYWGVSPGLMAHQAEYVVEVDKQTLEEYAREVDDEGTDSEELGEMLADLAKNTKRRLDFYAVVMAVFSILGIISAKNRKKLSGSICFAVVAMLGYLFWDDLKVNGDELNNEYDYLRDLCEETAADLVGYKLEKEVLKYRADVLKARFGADFSDDTETYDENYMDGG